MTVLYLKRCDSQMWLTKHYMCVITVSYLIIFNKIKTKISFFLSMFHESLVTATKWHSITEKSQGKTNNERKKQTMLSCVAHKVFSVNFCGLCFQFRNESLENGKKTTWPSKRLPQQIQPRICAFVWWNAKKKKSLGHSKDRYAFGMQLMGNLVLLRGKNRKHYF